jgi:hypothetical protein
VAAWLPLIDHAKLAFQERAAEGAKSQNACDKNHKALTGRAATKASIYNQLAVAD